MVRMTRATMCTDSDSSLFKRILTVVVQNDVIQIPLYGIQLEDAEASGKHKEHHQDAKHHGELNAYLEIVDELHGIRDGF